MGYANLPTLTAGQTCTMSGSLLLPSSLPSGFTSTDSVYIGMIADANGQVSESNEGNNSNQGTGIDSDLVKVTSSSSLAQAPLTDAAMLLSDRMARLLVGSMA